MSINTSNTQIAYIGNSNSHQLQANLTLTNNCFCDGVFAQPLHADEKSGESCLIKYKKEKENK